MRNISVWGTAVAVLVSIATTMAENEKPVIITQPTSVKAKVGDSVTFSVGAVDVNTQNEKSFTTSILGTVDLDMIWCPPGTFMMGSPTTEMGHQDNETLHQVTLTKGFWIGKYEVTQALYKAVMGSVPSTSRGNGDNYPVYHVGWETATNFCARLTQIERASGSIPMNYIYTLPTEAQWEYACRAGTTTGLNSGKEVLTSWLDTDANLDEVGWYKGNSSSATHEVGQKLPNAWGLYDMHGNVWEWCLDCYGVYPTTAVSDPKGSDSTDSRRVCRGGSWRDLAYYCRSAYRDKGYNPSSGGTRDNNYGLRVVLVPVK